MSTDLISFTSEQLDLIKSQIADDCSDSELNLFLAIARRTGLDPFSRQIYAIKRGKKMSIQTSIDGYRLIADRSERYCGADEAIFSHNAKGEVIKATFTVYKMVDGQRCPFTGVAIWDEYCPMYNGKIGEMWEKMPYTMLAKCAEAQALRRAFPADLSGIYTREEMMQSEEFCDTPQIAHKPAKESLPAAKTKPAAAPTPEKIQKAQDDDSDYDLMVTKPQLAKISELLKACKFSPAEKAQWQEMMRVEYHAENAKDLTQTNAEIIIADLDAIAHSKEMAHNA